MPRSQYLPIWDRVPLGAQHNFGIKLQNLKAAARVPWLFCGRLAVLKFHYIHDSRSNERMAEDWEE